MDLLQFLLDVVLHLDAHLAQLSQHYGAWIYVILFVIIFSETGFVVTPFLPGDSLLFVAGALAARGDLSLAWLNGALIVAAIAGNQANFAAGRWLGQRMLDRPGGSRFLRPEYVARTQHFFERHGGKTIVLSRFVPIVRTYAPFIAGVSRMPVLVFTFYNVLGAVTWVASLTVAGYLFGNLPFLRDHLTAVVLGVVVLSILPAAVEVLRARRANLQRRLP